MRRAKAETLRRAEALKMQRAEVERLRRAEVLKMQRAEEARLRRAEVEQALRAEVERPHRIEAMESHADSSIGDIVKQSANNLQRTPNSGVQEFDQEVPSTTRLPEPRAEKGGLEVLDLGFTDAAE